MMCKTFLSAALVLALLWPSSAEAQGLGTITPNTTTAAAAAAAATAVMPAAANPAEEPLPGARVDQELVLPVSAIPPDMGPLALPQAAASPLSPTNTTTAAANASLAAAALAAPLNATTNLTAGPVNDPHLAAAAAAVSLRDPVDVHTVGVLVPVAPGSSSSSSSSDTSVTSTRVRPKARQYLPGAAPTGTTPVHVPHNNTSKAVPSTPAVPVAVNGSLKAEGDPDVITILHYNDWHQRMEPMRDYAHALCDRTQADKGRCGGGIARMKTLVDRERAADPALLLLNAGDDFIGTVWDHKYGSKAAAHFQDRLRPDAMVVGNHEFDWGSDSLGNYLQSLSYPALGACNLDFKGHWLAGKISAWTTKEVKGRKVCIMGLTTTAAPTSEMYPVWVKDPYSSGRDCAKALKEQHPDCALTVLLSHLGYTADVYAAKLIPGLDLVIGGHSHSFLWHDKDNPPRYDTDYGKSDYVWGDHPTWVDVGSGRKVAVVQAGWGSRYIGKLQVQFQPGSSTISGIRGSPILLGSPNSDNHVEEDQALKQEVMEWKYW